MGTLEAVGRQLQTLVAQLAPRLRQKRGSALECIHMARAGTEGALAGTARWSDYDDSTPISNVITWKALVKAQTGLEPNRLLVSSEVMAHLQQCDEVRGAFVALANAPARVAIPAVSDAFLALAGVTV